MEYRIQVDGEAIATTVKAGSPALAIKRALDGWTPACGNATTSGPGRKLKMAVGSNVGISVVRLS